MSKPEINKVLSIVTIICSGVTAQIPLFLHAFTWTFLLLTVCPKEAIPLSGSETFSSPNCPMSNYTASTECTWIITATDGKYVKVVFTDFALSSCADSCGSANCSYVELYDGCLECPLLGRFCRGPTAQPTFSRGQQMFVKFHSGQTVDRGFEANYSFGKWPEICFWLSPLER